MKRKYKMTGCARFFIVLIILVPLAYLGASYYNGEDGIQNIKNLLGIGTSGQESDASNDTYSISNKDLEKTVEDQNNRLEMLEREIRDLKSQVQAKDKEIDRLRQQLKDAGIGEQ